MDIGRKKATVSSSVTREFMRVKEVGKDVRPEGGGHDLEKGASKSVRL
jgi:hypothetical protein